MNDPTDLTLALATAIMGAGESVYVRGNSDLLRRSGLTEGHLLAVDSRLDLRCLLCQPTFKPEDDPFIGLDVSAIDEPFPDSRQAASRDWQMRRIDGKADRIDILIDASQWLAIEESRSGDFGGGQVSGSPRAAARRYLREWSESDQIDLLFLEGDDDLYEEDDSLIVVDPKGHWDALLAEVVARPENLEEMGDRKFEEFVAELLTRDGFQVRLTPQTRDGGFDVLAIRQLSAFELMFLVECKRYRRSRKVGVSIVRNLYGLVSEKRANAGLIVTTSTFSKPAIDTSRSLGSQIALQDYLGLVEWMKRLRG